MKRQQDVKISVIIPCYNSEKTIAGTLNSLANQTFQDFEAVIVDDGSTDKTLSVVSSYKKFDIKLIRIKHQGVSHARNRGMEASDGDYIVFLDSDDRYKENFLEELYNSLVKSGRDIAIARYELVREAEKDSIIFPKKILITKNELFWKVNQHRKEKINFCCAIYVKKLLQKNDIKFSEKLKYGEDTQFLLEYLSYCNRGGILIDAFLYSYFIHRGSVTHNIDYYLVQNIYAHKNGLRNWVSKNEITKIQELTVLSRAVWAVLKDFAKTDNELYERFQREHKIKNYMTIMTVYSDEFIVRLSAVIYLVSPLVFRYAVRFYNKVEGSVNFETKRKVR